MSSASSVIHLQKEQVNHEEIAQEIWKFLLGALLEEWLYAVCCCLLAIGGAWVIPLDSIAVSAFAFVLIEFNKYRIRRKPKSSILNLMTRRAGLSRSLPWARLHCRTPPSNFNYNSVTTVKMVAGEHLARVGGRDGCHDEHHQCRKSLEDTQWR